jgi:lysyl-tRNA synthetase class 2
VDIELLRERANIIRRVRAFFDAKNYLETDTPLLAPDLIPESCIEVFETIRLPPQGSRSAAKPYWLIPSPEIWMKRLIARHRTSLFQICKCFRNGESSGRQHSPEFTMLEYYTMEADYLDSLELTEELFNFLLGGTNSNGTNNGVNSPSELSPPFIRISVGEAFETWAGFDLYRAARTSGAMEREARRLGLDPPPGLSVPELYDLIFIHAVEPRLTHERPVALMDYPAFVPCLAKKSPGGDTVERWELYIRGIELANCFTEETNAGEVRRFFESEKAAKEQSAIVRHKVDDGYWKIFGTKDAFPPCSGVAMGLDRLIMVLCGRRTLDGVLPFPME